MKTLLTSAESVLRIPWEYAVAGVGGIVGLASGIILYQAKVIRKLSKQKDEYRDKYERHLLDQIKEYER